MIYLDNIYIDIITFSNHVQTCFFLFNLIIISVILLPRTGKIVSCENIFIFCSKEGLSAQDCHEKYYSDILSHKLLRWFCD